MSEDVTVVVVDDQDLVRAGLVALLDAAYGIKVVGQARDGEEAIATIARLAPDVVLMDIRMPVMDGIEAITRIKADPVTATTHAVVLTTFGLDEYVFAALRAGADAFLLKDIDPDELERSVRRVAAGDAVISAAVTRVLIDEFLARPTTISRRHPPDLTPRERDILTAVCEGLANQQIAEKLFVGEATVKTYIGRLFEKFLTNSRVGLVLGAHDCGILDR